MDFVENLLANCCPAAAARLAMNRIGSDLNRRQGRRMTGYLRRLLFRKKRVLSVDCIHKWSGE